MATAWEAIAAGQGTVSREFSFISHPVVTYATRHTSEQQNTRSARFFGHLPDRNYYTSQATASRDV